MKKINNTIRYINDNQALVTKAFEKQARVFNSPEFKLWREYKAMFPEAEMVTKNIKRNTTKRTYKNLTYANMERFLKVQPNGEKLVKELNEKKEAASIEENFARLEEIIKRLEAGEESLEETFAGYEAGIKLVQSLNGQIDKVEKQIQILSEGEDND